MSPALADGFPSTAPPGKSLSSYIYFENCGHIYIKKVECQRIDAYEMWCWRRLLGVPCTAKRSNQFILKEISSERSLEGLMLNVKLQYIGHLMRRVDSFEKSLSWERLKARGEGDDRGSDGGVASLSHCT